MTDRELLELAAKAAGYTVEWHEVVVSRRGRFGLIEHTKKEGFRLNFQRWDPRTDDGDALRLAVKLELEVSLGQFGTIIYSGCGKVEEIGEDGCDEMALCRRAITRAAAEIGKDMQ